MGQCYGHLSLEERVEIYRLHAGGRSQNEIASALDRAPSTISRQLRRNSRPAKVWTGGYEPVRAQQLAERRRRWDGRFKLARQPVRRSCVGNSLAMGHSPEQIAGRLARQHGRVIISHESIYRFIYHRAALKDCWHRLLPRRKRTPGHRPGRSPPASSNNGVRSPNALPRSKAAGRRAIGKPTSCCSPDAANRSEPWLEECLLIEWPKGEKEPTKYWLSRLPPDIGFARLVDLAKLRCASSAITRSSSKRSGLATSRAADGAASTVTPRCASLLTDS
jgi:Helix-turn-helix domain